MRPVKIGIIGDHDPKRISHPATEAALLHAGDRLGVHVEVAWLGTEKLRDSGAKLIEPHDGLWSAPGTYASSLGAIEAIRLAREERRPFIGTCGGFQHVVLEYARNVLGFEDSAHGEIDPYASNLFITGIACSPFGKRMRVEIEEGSQAHAYYGRAWAEEEYRCDFGMNEERRKLLEAGGLHVSGFDQDHEARIVELSDHPFFLATLFVPQMSSTADEPHPLIVAFVDAAEKHTREQPGRARVGRSKS